MTISTKARQAKIDALNTAISLINKEIGNPTGFEDFEGNLLAEMPLYFEALAGILRHLEHERDEAALRQYKRATRNNQKGE